MRKLLLGLIIVLLVTGCSKNENKKSCKIDALQDSKGYVAVHNFEVDDKDNILNLKLKVEFSGDENYINNIEINQVKELMTKFKHNKDIKITFNDTKKGANLELIVNCDEITSDEKIKLFAYLDTYVIKGTNFKNNLIDQGYTCE